VGLDLIYLEEMAKYKQPRWFLGCSDIT